MSNRERLVRERERERQRERETERARKKDWWRKRDGLFGFGEQKA